MHRFAELNVRVDCGVCRAWCCCFRIYQQTTGATKKSDCCSLSLIGSSSRLPMLPITTETVLWWHLAVP